MAALLRIGAIRRAPGLSVLDALIRPTLTAPLSLFNKELL